MHRDAPRRERVAVVGSGVSGLTAAYLLQRRYDVVLFEAAGRPGGHADTRDVAAPGGRVVSIDTGFIVHNERTYPNLTRLFGELGVTTRETDMSMSVACKSCGLEYAGAKGLRGLFAQPGSVARPRFLRMLTDVKRSHRHARRVLRSDDCEAFTLGAFLASAGYSSYFTRHFIVPLVSAVWSAGAEITKAYPARYLFRFLDNHGMLSVTGSPVWRTVEGGSRSYVERATKGLTAVELATPVRSLRRTSEGIEIRDDDDEVHHVDRAVIATHADEALALLADPTDAEREVLGAFRYSRNQSVLHTDATILPNARWARASWNYRLADCRTASTALEPVVVSYDMNRLHRIAEPVRYVVSLNASGRVRADAVVEQMTYDHPVYTLESVAAQPRLPELSGERLAFAGAYHGSGFHEDGCLSGVRAATALGVAW